MFGTAQTAEKLETIVTIPKTTLRMWLNEGKNGKDDPYWAIEEIEEGVLRVNRGARLLDARRPTWVFGVLPENLDMSSGELCIIGQTYGDFDDHVGIPFGMNGVGWDEMDVVERDKTSELATTHGFLADDGSVPYAVLDRIWVFMLVERHNRDGQPVFLRLP